MNEEIKKIEKKLLKKEFLSPQNFEEVIEKHMSKGPKLSKFFTIINEEEISKKMGNLSGQLGILITELSGNGGLSIFKELTVCILTLTKILLKGEKQ